jgi:hypothetical protein
MRAAHPRSATVRRQKSGALLLAACVAVCFVQAARAQTGPPAALKFDDFGDVYPTDAAARLDNFANALQERPATRGFIIVYRSHRDLPGLSSRHLNWMRRYLIKSRGLPAERVVGVDGGEASCLAHEFWIVQPGAAPKPRDDAYARSLDDNDSARKFDEYYYSTPNELDSYSTEYESGVEGFAEALRKEPRAQAYMIAYEGYRVEREEEEGGRGRKKTTRRVVIDPPGTALRELRQGRDALVKGHGIAAARVKLVRGGYRKWRQLELWIVPPGEHAPVPTPNAFPKGRR